MWSNYINKFLSQWLVPRVVDDISSAWGQIRWPPWAAQSTNPAPTFCAGHGYAGQRHKSVRRRWASFGHELANRAVYARQYYRNVHGPKRSFVRTLFPTSRQETQAGTDILLGALGLKRFQPPAIQEALTATESPEKREALRRAGKLVSFGESIAGKSGSLSALIDFAYNFVDPTLAVGRVFKAITLVDDAAKAQRVLSKTPAAFDALAGAVAKRAAKAAALAPPGMDVGDVRLLQRLVPSLRGPRSETTELAAALASRDGDTALAYLQKLEDSAQGAIKEGNPAARQFLADIQDAISKVKDLGMAYDSRLAILRTSLGRTWKPRARPVRCGRPKSRRPPLTPAPTTAGRG